jgi:hypothetical protein
VSGTVLFHDWRNGMVVICFLRFIPSFLTGEDETTWTPRLQMHADKRFFAYLISVGITEKRWINYEISARMRLYVIMEIPLLSSEGMKEIFFP